MLDDIRVNDKGELEGKLVESEWKMTEMGDNDTYFIDILDMIRKKKAAIDTTGKVDEMTNEETIKMLKYMKRLGDVESYYGRIAIDNAIDAISQLERIKQIINNPAYIQEDDAFRYKMIKEVLESEDEEHE